MTSTATATIIPRTALGDYLREHPIHEPDDNPRRSRSILRAMLIAVLGVVAFVGVAAPSAQAWFADDAVSKISNWCGPEDVPNPDTATGSIDGLLNLNSVNPETQITALPDASGEYADYEIIGTSYSRYGFSALKMHVYGVGCGNLVARMMPTVYNGILMLFVHMPTAITILMIKVALSPLVTSFLTSLAGPFFKAWGALMKPIVSILVPAGTFLAWVRSKGNLARTAAVGAYGFFMASLVFYSANDTSGLTKLMTLATNATSQLTGQVVGNIAAVSAPGLTQGEDGEVTTTSDTAQMSQDDIKSPSNYISDALWKGVPLSTWTSAQLGPTMADAVGNGDTDAVKWQARVLNSHHVGQNSDGKLDEGGKRMRAAIDAWNSRSYAITGDDTKTDAWTDGFDGETDGSTFSSGANTAWQNIPFLADAGKLCGQTLSEDLANKRSGDRKHNLWGFNGACDPGASDVPYANDMISYWQGANFVQAAGVIIAGILSALIVAHLVGPIGFYISIQKLLLLWLLIFSPVFIGIASFGDEKRKAFAKAFGEQIAFNIIKQIVAVASLVMVSYLFARILSSNVFFFLKPLLVLLLGSSLLALFLVFRRIARAAIRGDASIVEKTAKAPVKAAKTTAKVTAVTAAVAATGGAAAVAAGGGAAAYGGGLSGASAAAAKGTPVLGRAVSGGAKAILSNPVARRRGLQTLSGRGGKVGRAAQRVLAANDTLHQASGGHAGGGVDLISRAAQGGRAGFKAGVSDLAGKLSDTPGQGPRPRRGAPTPSSSSQLPPSTPGQAAKTAAGNVPGAPGKHAETVTAEDVRNSAQMMPSAPGRPGLPGTAVAPDGVQSAAAAASTAGVGAAIVENRARVATARGAQASAASQEAVTALESQSPHVLTAAPVEGAVPVDSMRPESLAKIASIAGGDATALPAAAATVAVAQAATQRLEGIYDATSFGGINSQMTTPSYEGRSLEAALGMTAAAAAAQPEEFIARAMDSDLYGRGSSLVGMDPRSTVTTAYKAALGASAAGNSEEYASAIGAMAQALQDEGLPAVVSDVRAAPGSDLARQAGATLNQAAALAATYEPPATAAEWGDFSTQIGALSMTLPEEAWSSPAGMALGNLNAIASDPTATVDDVRAAAGLFVQATNMAHQDGYFWEGMPSDDYGDLPEAPAGRVSGDDIARFLRDNGFTGYEPSHGPRAASRAPAAVAEALNRTHQAATANDMGFDDLPDIIPMALDAGDDDEADEILEEWRASHQGGSIIADADFDDLESLVNERYNGGPNR